MAHRAPRPSDTGAGAGRQPREGGVTMLMARASKTEGRGGSQRRLDEGGRYLGIPQNGGLAAPRTGSDDADAHNSGLLSVQETGCGTLEASRSSCRQAPLQVPAASMESLRITRAAVGTERRQAVSYSISTLLTRNLHDVFGENDPERRRAAIDDIFTEDGVFYDPSKGVYRGRDEIDRVAGAIRATHPDFRYQPIAGPEELGNGGRIQWVSGRPGEAPAYAGTDFIIARDGRIAALYLFFDRLP